MPTTGSAIRDAYRAAVLASAGWAAATDGLATVGLVPAAPVTGFGYIEVGVARGSAELAPAGRAVHRDRGGSAAALPAFEAAGFKEKPSAEVAQTLRRRTAATSGTSGSSPGRLGGSSPSWTPPIPSSAATIDRGGRCAPRRRRRAGQPASTRRCRLQAVEPLVLERTQRLTVVAGVVRLVRPRVVAGRRAMRGSPTATSTPTAT